MKDKPSVFVEPSLTVLSQRLADRFCELAKLYISTNGNFHAAFSGGNTPQFFFQLLKQEPYKSQLDWLNIHLYIVDERFVPLSHQDSNAGTLKRLLINHIPLPASHFHFIETEGINPEIAAANYETALYEYLPRGKSNLPQFDFILLGTAADGHIASLFPDTMSLTVYEKLTAATYVEKLQSQRITLTFPAINSARHLCFLVTGEKKAPVIKRVFAGTKPYYPIQMLNPEGSVEWYLDHPQDHFT